ncbi:MAG: flagellar filament capping protein FliD [Actinomycetota bacterium]
MSSTSSLSSSSLGFTAGGIDSNQIVSSLMAAETIPQDRLRAKQANIKLKQDTMGRINNSLTSLRSAASTIALKGISQLTTSVSSPTTASATVGSGATTGALSFTVDSIATTHGQRSTLTMPSATSTVTSASVLGVSSSLTKLGVSGLSVSSTGVSPGSYSVQVTQASAAASRTASTALATSTTVDSTNNTLAVSVNGTARTVSIAAGTYTKSALAAAVQTAFDSSGGGVTVSTDSAGKLSFATTREGSTASLQFTGGTALAATGLATVDASAISGVDGKIKVGTGAETTVTNAEAGQTTSVAAGSSGSVNFTLNGGLRLGTGSLAVVSTGDRSLNAVVSAINSVSAGVTAAAVKQSTGNWLLQLNSTGTGVANKILVGLEVGTSSAIGGLIDTTTAQDAQITVGSGAGAYKVTASGNTFSDVMPGVTLNVAATSTTPVTVSVTRDEASTANSVSSLIAAANSVIGQIQNATLTDPVAKKSSPLSGDSSVKGIIDKVRSTVMATVSGITYTSASSVGIKTEKDGTLSFNQTDFIAALRADPTATERAFGRGGTTSGNVIFANADDVTLAGTYAVNITTAATQATTGTIAPNTASAKTIGVRMGSTTATATIPAGATNAQIVDALNTALGSAGLAVNASTASGGVSLTSNLYGVGGKFDVNLDATNTSSSWTTYTGVDVVGTIDGKTATGVGQRLSLATSSTSNARGLQVDVATGVTGAQSTTYSPGVAARVTALINQLTDTKGSFTVSSTAYDTRYKTYDTQINAFTDRLTAKETTLKAQWAKVQTSLAQLQSKQTWLTNQVKSMTANNGN